ncbi:uncharacterized protein [Temnothorax longispinosus]|uniref:uncharacterized protein n=1 Tax=Temnothorax longispinosus TaxID=300112 RepID=UPI003A99A003
MYMKTSSKISTGYPPPFGSVRYNVSRKVDGIVGSTEGRKVIAEFLVVFVRSYRLTRSKKIRCKFNVYRRNQLKPRRNMKGSGALIESATTEHLTTHLGGREGNGSKGGGMAGAATRTTRRRTPGKGSTTRGLPDFKN